MKKGLPYIIPIFRSALFIIGGLFFAAITNQTLDESTKWWPVLCIVFNVITILVLVLVCKYEGSDYRDLINYKKGQLNFKNILLIIILMLSIGVGGVYVFGLAIYGYVPTILIQPIQIWIAIINTILLPVTIVFAELPLYYGYSFGYWQLRQINIKADALFSLGKDFPRIYPVPNLSLQKVLPGNNRGTLCLYSR